MQDLSRTVLLYCVPVYYYTDCVQLIKQHVQQEYTYTKHIRLLGIRESGLGACAKVVATRKMGPVVHSSGPFQ